MNRFYNVNTLYIKTLPGTAGGICIITLQLAALVKDRQVPLYFNKYSIQMETTKILETERGNKDAVHLHWNETDETWNAYGKSAENALAINPELRTLTDKTELDGTQVMHLKVTIEQLEDRKSVV